MIVNDLIKTKSFIEQHFHGAYGVNFNTATEFDITYLAEKLISHGITLFYPTLHTDSLENLKNQIKIIKQAKKNMPQDFSQIGGVHLEGPFINPDKSGIHPKEFILKPSVETFLELYDDIIKIVTLAPELDENLELCHFLQSKHIKISAGHTKTNDLSMVGQVTHMFNAMEGVSHKEPTTATLALTDDNISTEVIPDLIHVVKPALELVFKAKPDGKILLISDCLPVAYEKGHKISFCNEDIKLTENGARNAAGVLAGSALLLDDLVKSVSRSGIISFDKAVRCATQNVANNLSIAHEDYLYWDKFMDIKKVVMNGKIVFEAST